MSIHNSQCKIRDVFYYAKSLSTELRDVNKEIGENSGLTWMKVPELFLFITEIVQVLSSR